MFQIPLSFFLQKHFHLSAFVNCCAYECILHELNIRVALKRTPLVFLFLPGSVSEEQLTEFVENKDYMTLLSTFRSFKRDEEIVHHVLCCLHSLAVTCEYPLGTISALHTENCAVSLF